MNENLKFYYLLSMMYNPEEVFEDAFGNKIITYLPIDDIAITFVFKGDELMAYWVND